ncbi:MAG: shikimate dehydrogenase [Simkaniaceae bacterium]
MMLTVVLDKKTYKENAEIMAKAKGKAEGYELRLDCLEEIDKEKIKNLIDKASTPIIFTLRKSSQGGNFMEGEEKQKEILLGLVDLQPAFIDLEYDTSLSTAQELLDRSLDTRLICSIHDFEKTPESIDEFFLQLKLFPAHIYKIATYARSINDALKMVRFVIANKRMNKNVVGICMGEKGQITRILSPIIGNFINYCCLEKEAAPGQLALEELLDVYHYDKLNEATKVFALIGDPVDKSPSHITHNKVFEKLEINALYVKMCVKKDEVETFFSLIKGLPFAGFSVTMPLKEEVLPYLHEVSEEAKLIGAVNTIAIKDSKRLGYNTDAAGALDPLEEKIPVAGKKVVILGGGGAAKALAYEAKNRGAAKVVLLNRTKERAEKIAANLDLSAGSLDDMKKIAEEGYDILINATSVGMEPNTEEIPISPEYILASACVMDIISRPKKTKLLQEAEKKGCKTVYGHEMFINQAVYQYDYWFDRQLERKKVKEILEKSVDSAAEKKMPKESP